MSHFVRIITVPLIELMEYDRDFVARAVERAKRDLAYEVATAMGDRPHTVSYKILQHPRYDDFDIHHKITIQADVIPARMEQMIIQPVFEPPGPRKHRCTWCGGITIDDQYGHCSACGGPRSS